MNRSRIGQSLPSVMVIKMYGSVTVSDEISLICTLLYTEALKYQ